ncbi:SRPBCC family protein [Crocosphaera sp. UHCC 0190]|uniref:SRPBCC family protein n=1 Tax=Crocosphaera sp. UHCC 0190 TaxID=3110246 RepID=UPI002B217071|nr:SRPBCC family protein [Crocosphaera sp. UHCC 0190]MEA5510985.1 SRPBCC family protein [Crocosphaera sp. UHCC 0190]
MILNFSLKLIFAKGKLLCSFSLYKRYRAMSTAPADVLWHKLIDLADVSWHPLFSKTNVPLGLIAKPGLIYQVVTRLTPIPIRLFVENVRPGELLSLRVLTIPGMEQKITYHVESTLCGTYISYSVTLRGWLSPVIWWLIKPYSARVATELANAAERLLA